VLLRPRWLAGHALALTLAALFIALGIWQWHRNTEKQHKTAAAHAAYAAPAPDLLTAAPGDGEAAQATGTYDAAHEVLLRNTVHGSDVGDDILTPMKLADGTTVLVDRGWLPAGTAETAGSAPAPAGAVMVRGLVNEPRALSSQDTARTVAGRLSLPRVDLDRIDSSLPYKLRPVWLTARFQDPAPGPNQPLLPQPPPPDQVNHIEYTIEWFSFALIAIIGWPIVLWQIARRQTVTQ
jgi:cytochrome oxidase assembly protein ShyY1